MTRTRRLLLFAVPAGLAVALIAAWLLWPRTAITRENAEKIQVGMTLAEVEAILGGPARDDQSPGDPARPPPPLARAVGPAALFPLPSAGRSRVIEV
jgi:hypothetical protein